MTTRELLSVMMIQRSNFEVLHWKAKGRHFDNVHNNVTTGYYEMVSDDIDTIAEMGMRMGYNPLNYITAYKVASKICGNKLEFVDANVDYSRDEIIDKTDKILQLILLCIAQVLTTDEMQNNIRNVGIKATLESMYDKYDKECRFLNARRKMD